MHVETIGSGPRVVLVHGSVAPGWMTWANQKTLGDSFTLVVPTRTGYPPNPPLERIDFEIQAGELAEILEPGDHLVGHSYGGVVSLLSAAHVSERIRSLTVVEPPAFGVARGNPAVEEFLDTIARAPRDPRGYLDYFMPLVGSTMRLPDPLPAELEAGARAALAERWPSEAVIPLEQLATASFPKLVVSGAHNPAFDAVCNVLERGLDAVRAVIPGAGHRVPRMGGPFNEVLSAFFARG